MLRTRRFSVSLVTDADRQGGTNARSMRVFGTDLLTVRVDLDPR